MEWIVCAKCYYASSLLISSTWYCGVVKGEDVDYDDILCKEENAPPVACIHKLEHGVAFVERMREQ